MVVGRREMREGREEIGEGELQCWCLPSFFVGSKFQGNLGLSVFSFVVLLWLLVFCIER